MQLLPEADDTLPRFSDAKQTLFKAPSVADGRQWLVDPCDGLAMAEATMAQVSKLYKHPQDQMY